MPLGQIQSLVAKRVRTCVRRRRVSHILCSGEHRAFGAPMNQNCTLWTLRVAWLKAFSLLRFFVALDKEMTCRHAQWLTVIKKLANLSRSLTLKAATRHRLRPLTPEPSNPASTPTNPCQPAQPTTGSASPVDGIGREFMCGSGAAEAGVCAKLAGRYEGKLKGSSALPAARRRRRRRASAEVGRMSSLAVTDQLTG